MEATAAAAKAAPEVLAKAAAPEQGSGQAETAGAAAVGGMPAGMAGMAKELEARVDHCLRGAAARVYHRLRGAAARVNHCLAAIVRSRVARGRVARGWVAEAKLLRGVAAQEVNCTSSMTPGRP